MPPGSLVNCARRFRVEIFVGPSLSRDEVYSAFHGVDVDLRLHRPVEQGDILRVVDDPPDVVAIVDGDFFSVPAVLHREILLALERGIRVLGASSIGALRAVELDRFGMEGVGQIYRLYKRAAIDADDEVAVLHGGEAGSYLPLTVPLVNVRYNIRRARRRGIIAASTAAVVIESARRLHFTQRTYEAALEGARVQLGADAGDELSALASYLRDQAVDLKRRDAQTLLRTLRRRLAGAEPWPPRPSVNVHQTTHFARYQTEYVGRWVGGVHVPDQLVVSFQKLLAPELLGLCRRMALRCLALERAAQIGIAPDPPEALTARFRQSHGLTDDRAFGDWLLEHVMSERDLLKAVEECDVEAKVLAAYRGHRPEADDVILMSWVKRGIADHLGLHEGDLAGPFEMGPGVPWSGPLVRELKIQGKFRPALRLAAEILSRAASFREQNPAFSWRSISRAMLSQFLAELWEVDPDQVAERVRLLAFAGQREFLTAARHIYLYRELTGSHQ